MIDNSGRLANLNLVETLSLEMLDQAQSEECDWQALASMAQRRQVLLENLFAEMSTLSHTEASQIERVLQSVTSCDAKLEQLGEKHRQELVASLQAMAGGRKAIRQYQKTSKS